MIRTGSTSKRIMPLCRICISVPVRDPTKISNKTHDGTNRAILEFEEQRGTKYEVCLIRWVIVVRKAMNGNS
jgi:hypothetical protein